MLDLEAIIASTPRAQFQVELPRIAWPQGFPDLIHNADLLAQWCRQQVAEVKGAIGQAAL